MNNKNSISKNRTSYIQQKFKSFVKPLIHGNIENIQQKNESFVKPKKRPGISDTNYFSMICNNSF